MTPPPGRRSTTCTGRRWAAASRWPGRSPRRCPTHHDVTLLGPEPRRRRAAPSSGSASTSRRCALRHRRTTTSTRPPPAPTTTCSSTAPTAARPSTAAPLGWYYVHFPEPPPDAARARPPPPRRRRRHGAVDPASAARSDWRRVAGRLRPSRPADRVRPDATTTYLANSRVHRATGSSDCGACPTEVLYPPVRPEVGPGDKRPIDPQRRDGSSTPARATPRSSSS